MIARHILLAATGALSLGAQELRRCSPSADSVALPCELDAWPGSSAVRLVPRYPDILRQAGVSGTVVMRYAIDTSGRVLPGSVRIVEASHDLFATFVRRALQEVSFAPPRRNGSPVRVRVEESVRFEPPGDDVSRFFARAAAATHSMDTAGSLRTTVLSYPRRDTTLSPLSDRETWAIYHAVADKLMQAPATAPSAYCVEVDGRRPPDHLFARWRTAGRRVVPLAECPRTYASMIARPEGAPSGWVDPIRIGLLAPKPWTSDVVLLEARESQGAGTRHFVCEVVRDTDGWDTVTCVLKAYTMS